MDLLSRFASVFFMKSASIMLLAWCQFQLAIFYPNPKFNITSLLISAVLELSHSLICFKLSVFQGIVPNYISWEIYDKLIHFFHYCSCFREFSMHNTVSTSCLIEYNLASAKFKNRVKIKWRFSICLCLFSVLRYFYNAILIKYFC